MATVVLKSLMKRLDAACRSALDGAAGLCVARTNAAVEIEHWVAKLAESTDTDFALILEEFGINRSRVMGDALRSLERFRPTEPRPPVLSGQLVELVREAWLVASINFESPVIRSGHLLLALLTSEVHGQIAESISREFGRISIEDLKNRYAAIVSSSSEEVESRVASANSNGTSPIVRDTATPALDQYTIDLTEQARSGKIDPIVGRDSEIRQMIDILTRRRQNNPVIVGEAGVGKTAVVEGLALKIAHEAVPHVLRNVSLRSLDLGLLQAGASVRGEFESRLRGVIDEVKASTTPIILFIDEAHMLIGAGGPAGQGDAANLLKPALARGELRTIAATTWSEYKKIFEQDAALTRRFQLIKVDEPDDEKATAMMRGIVPALSLHHQVDILDEAIRDSVRMSRRYLPGRQLPDKSVSLLDTACARVALGQMCAPPAVEDCEQAIDQLGVEIDFLEAEAQTGREEPERLAKLKERRRLRQEEWAVLNDRWKEEETLVKRIREVRASVTQADGPAEAVPNPEALKELRDLERQLKAVQGQRPLVEPFVSSSVIASVISEWTGIPVGRMLSDEVDTVLRLPEFLKKRVVGQDHALEMTAQRIKSSRAGLTDPGKPIGVFLFVGPSGVGKTESALALADVLYGGRQSLTIINMSEFKEEHKVSMLCGAPPGYVGYGEGGILTDAIRRRPYGIVLLDEMEKAHPGVQDVFYQVFDKGMLRDGQGRDIDCRNCMFIMTSNACTALIDSLCHDAETAPTSEKLVPMLHDELLKTFKPAFLGRTTVVPYYPLADDVLREITRMNFAKLAGRLQEHYSSELIVEDELIESIVQRSRGSDGGARIIDRIVTNEILPEVATEFLTRTVAEQHLPQVRLGYDAGKGRFVFR